MKQGKVSESILKRSILKQIKTKRNEFINGAGVGVDCAIFALSDDPESMAISLSTDPITGATKDVAKLAVHVTANDIAASGAEPIGIMLTILLPLDTEETELKAMMQQAEEACAELHIQLCGGHTEVTSAVNQPILTATGIGKIRKDASILAHLAGPDQDVVISKWIGLEGTSILAKEKEQELLTRYPAGIIDTAKEFDQYLSIVPEAATAGKSGVYAMHDITEGGIFGALWEIAENVGVGLEIDLKKIPIKQETIEICDFFDINPYELVSSGSLLMITDHGHDLVRTLEQSGVPAAVIGKTTAGHDRVVINEEERRFLEPPKTDTLWKALS